MSGNHRNIAIALICSLALAASAQALTVDEVADVETKVDEAPTPVRTFAPEYPAALRSARVNGVVSVAVVVDETGEVLASDVVKSTHDEFKAPALDAIRRWKFKPAKLAGKAVRVRVNIPVRFNVE